MKTLPAGRTILPDGVPFSIVRQTPDGLFTFDDQITYHLGSLTEPLNGPFGTSPFAFVDDPTIPQLVYNGNTDLGLHFYLSTIVASFIVSPEASTVYSLSIDVDGTVAGTSVNSAESRLNGVATVQGPSGDTIVLVTTGPINVANGSLVAPVFLSDQGDLIQVSTFTWSLVRLADV